MMSKSEKPKYPSVAKVYKIPNTIALKFAINEDGINKEMLKIKESLNNAKDEIDSVYKTPSYKLAKNFDPFYHEKKHIALMLAINPFYVTNAYIKMVELFWTHDLLVPINTLHNTLHKIPDKILHFDNCAFPGAFIAAVEHCVNTWIPDIKYEWRASSLSESNLHDLEPLGDMYGYMRNNREKWLIPACNGDVTKMQTQEYIMKYFNHTVNLYTSDVGFEVSGDNFNLQEILHIPVHFGQCYSAIISLAVGGNAVFKTFTFFEPFSISLIYLLASFFTEFYLTKPYSSREANSEIYLVGLGFTGYKDNDPRFVKMTECMKLIDKGKVPEAFFNFDQYPVEFQEVIIQAAKETSESTQTKILADLKRISAAYKWSTENYKKDNNPIIKDFLIKEEPKILKWYMANIPIPCPFKQISAPKNLQHYNEVSVTARDT